MLSVQMKPEAASQAAYALREPFPWAHPCLLATTMLI
jgi:hypothetical protein